MKRPAYKALYLAEQMRSKQAEFERDSVKLELGEYKTALAPLGEQVITAHTPSDDAPIDLIPWQYVSVRAFIDSHATVVRRQDYGQGYVNLAWRGRPIRRTA